MENDMKATKIAAFTLAGLMSTAVFATGTTGTDRTENGGYGSMDGTTNEGTRSGMPASPGMNTGTGVDTDTGTGTGAGVGTGTGTDGMGTGTGAGGMGTGTGTGTGGGGGAGGAGRSGGWGGARNWG